MSDVIDTDLKQAAAYIVQHAHEMRAILTIAEKIGDGDKLTQMIAEGQSRLDAVNALLETSTKQVEAKAAEFAELQAKGVAAEQEALDRLARADADAAATRGKAETDAAAVIDHAQQQAASIIAETRRQNEDAEAQLANTRARLAEAQTALNALRVEADAAQQRIDDARATLRKMAEG